MKFHYGAMILLLLAGETPAHPGHGDGPSERVWTQAGGVFELAASFVAARDGKVQLRASNGTLIMIPIDRLSHEPHSWIGSRQTEIRLLNEGLPLQLALGPTAGVDAAAEIAKAFEPFARLKALTYRSDDRYFYVESNGIPDHPLMIGIRAWQQQVPLAQTYAGANAWQIPLQPRPAKQPLSAKSHFFRGAIGLAVNGVPIFNPIKNDGKTDTLLAGELDEYGGHCGRADDYHYHIAPVHLQKTVGKGQPIGYALDGYPIYGYEEPDGSPAVGLDWLNGHKDVEGNYHYHATKTYPYLNGGFYGEVVERDGQVDPQPRAEPVRPALPPLRDAMIVDFAETRPGSYRLTYDVKGRQGSVSFTLAGDGSVKFTFVDPQGRTNSETYTPKQPRFRPGDNRPSPRSNNPARERQASAATPEARRPLKFVVMSSSVDGQGRLSVDCTCDGGGVSPALAWNSAPQGTKCFALSLWHIAPDQEKSYWVVYNIPADVSQLPQNARGAGLTGLNDKRRAAYDPMCSKGPGLKTYHLTMYALSAELSLAPEK